MEKLSQSDKKKMKLDIYKLNKFQWNKIKDLIDEETSIYTVKNDGIYLRLNLLSDILQIKIKKYIDDCILELENIDDNLIKLEENDSETKNIIQNSNINFIQNENVESGNLDDVDGNDNYDDNNIEQIDNEEEDEENEEEEEAEEEEAEEEEEDEENQD